ncbi:MAG: winged helix-turn-helix domain-containing protein [Planctomycetota bacterium]|jgi:DNA-binding transcriptional ArsR family regulator
MRTSDIGPITTSIYQAKHDQPPGLIREWGAKLTRPGHFLLMLTGAARREGGRLQGWGLLLGHFGTKARGAGLADIPATNVERLLSPLAHEGRIRIMKALSDGPLSATALSRATGFRGGAMYHHLKELQHAAYVTQTRRRYGLTPLGCQLLLTVMGLASEYVADRGQEGLAMGNQWTQGPRKTKRRRRTPRPKKR